MSKMARMGHSDICSTSYGQKKGQGGGVHKKMERSVQKQKKIYTW
jgi:hypothetical protein